MPSFIVVGASGVYLDEMLADRGNFGIVGKRRIRRAKWRVNRVDTIRIDD